MRDKCVRVTLRLYFVSWCWCKSSRALPSWYCLYLELCCVSLNKQKQKHPENFVKISQFKLFSPITNSFNLSKIFNCIQWAFGLEFTYEIRVNRGLSKKMSYCCILLIVFTKLDFSCSITLYQIIQNIIQQKFKRRRRGKQIRFHPKYPERQKQTQGLNV